MKKGTGGKVEGFTFWAQSLDNTSSDHICTNGKYLPANDHLARRNALKVIDKLTTKGQTLKKPSGAKVVIHGRRFAIEVPSVDRDDKNRIAPIVCLGYYDGYDNNLGRKISDGINNFAHELGRTIDPIVHQDVIGSLKTVRVKRLRYIDKRSFLLWGIIIGIIITIIAVTIGIGNWNWV